MKQLFSVGFLTLVLFSVSAQQLKPVIYTDGNQKLNGLVTSNTGKKLQGVLILPAWKGIDQEAKQAALDLEKEGYIAFIADIYGEGNVPTDNAAAAKIASQYKQDYQAYQKRIGLALEQLKKAGADKIAVIGYCFGGTGALEAARAQFPVNGVISIHGGLGKDASRPNGSLPTKILIEHPAEDQSVPQEMVNNNQSFVGLEEPTMKLLLNGSFGSFFNTMGLS